MVQSLLIKYKLMWIYRSSRSWNRLMTFLPNNMSWDLGNIHTRRIPKRKWDQNDICLSPLITTKDRLFFFRKLIFLKGMFISVLWLLNYIFNAVHSHKIYKDNCKPAIQRMHFPLNLMVYMQIQLTFKNFSYKCLSFSENYTYLVMR